MDDEDRRIRRYYFRFVFVSGDVCVLVILEPASFLAAGKRGCERELWYEALGLPPRNCITKNRTLCPVCLDEVLALKRKKARKK